MLRRLIATVATYAAILGGDGPGVTASWHAIVDQLARIVVFLGLGIAWYGIFPGVRTARMKQDVE